MSRLREICNWPYHKVLLALMAGVLAACEHPDQLLSPQTDQTQIAQLRKLGFDPAHAVDAGDHYLIEGDIIVRKAALARIVNADSGKRPSVRPNQQAAVSSLPSAAAVSGINVDFSQITDTAWLSAARAALSNWNSVVGTTVHFVEASPANIVFKMTSLVMLQNLSTF